jgi:peptidoglycan/xylan/chitin deacetylase (PgdA/CDA1 family)
VREIAAAGHEVACHGYDHRLVYEQTPKAFRRDLRRARDTLEDLIGARVEEYRAPSASFLPPDGLGASHRADLASSAALSYAERAGAMVGVLPLFHVRSPLFGSMLVSTPTAAFVMGVEPGVGSRSG